MSNNNSKPNETAENELGAIANERFNELSNPPKEIFQQGVKLILQNLTNSTAIVGSRKVSEKGIQAAFEYASNVASADRIVISGLASGIDTAAFEGALSQNGICIAILPAGINHITPRSNINLVRRIIENGGTILSEYSEDMFAKKFMFVQRNRLIAALADTVVLGEAEINGGAWHTIRAAWKLKRNVMKLESNGTITPLIDPQRRLL